MKLLTYILATLIIVVATIGAIFSVETGKLPKLELPSITMPKLSLNNVQNKKKPRATLTPTKVPSTTPTPTPKVSPTPIKSLSQKLIYKYQNKVFVSDREGKNEARLLDSTGDELLLGWTDAETLYYASRVTKSVVSTFQKNLSTNEIIPLFTYEVYPDGDLYKNASVRSDGKYITYSKNGNIYLFDVENKTSVIVATGKNCKTADGNDDYSSDACYGYYAPTWSPDLKYIIAAKSYYEGGWYVSINPFAAEIKITEYRITPSEQKLVDENSYILRGSGYGRDSLYVINGFENPVATDLLSDGKTESYHYVSSFSRSNNNIVAFISTDYTNGKSRDNLQTYDLKTGHISMISPIKSNLRVNTWLPDNKTLLLTDDKKNVLKLDAEKKEFKSLPIKADEIYGFVE